MAATRGEAMTPRERVHAAAKGLPIDRVPVMYWLNPHMAARLMASFQPGRSRVWNLVTRYLWKRFSAGGEFHARELWRALPLLLDEYANSSYCLELGADVALQPIGTSSYVRRLYRKNGQLRVQDAFGSVRGMGGIYLDVIQPAIKGVNDLKDYWFPDFTDDKHYAGIRKLRQAHPGASILIETFGVQDLFSTCYNIPCRLRTFVPYSTRCGRFRRESTIDGAKGRDDEGMSYKPIIVKSAQRPRRRAHPA